MTVDIIIEKQNLETEDDNVQHRPDQGSAWLVVA